MELVAATRNQHKLSEIRTLLKGLPVKVVSLDTFKDVPEVAEDCDTFEGNAEKKAQEVSEFLKTIAIADDSGLEIDALGGEPGVFSARFSRKGAIYRSNNEKVLRLLKDVPLAKRNACFKCVIALADRGKVVGMVQGKCKGRIAFEPKGKAGFGYDPIFIPSGYKKTFAELGIREKNKISHRRNALIKARRLIAEYIKSR